MSQNKARARVDAPERCVPSPTGQISVLAEFLCETARATEGGGAETSIVTLSPLFSRSGSMATKLSGYSERERAVLHECRSKSALGGLKWGLPSLVPLWAAFRAGLLPRFAAAPCYTVSFVLFSFLGAMSNNQSCIENILALEDSELAGKLRKSLPRQARRFDQKRARESSSMTRGRAEGDMASSEATRRRVDMSQWAGQDRGREGKGGGGGDGDGGALMERQDKGRGVRKNKYGDVIFDDDVK